MTACRPRRFESHSRGQTAIFVKRVLLCFVAFTLIAIPATHRSFAEDALEKNPPRVRAIINARIVLSPGQVIERGILIIKDGLIVEVGKNVTVPVDAAVIDAKGLTAYAGFIDAAAPGLIDAARTPKPTPGRKADFQRQALAA
ncbi:MAG: hypothetical protein IID46_15930, partial [Planctomycetes bacterium]|nr:hypothetical protein [Planctomycetota bacterium]